ncbi:ABC transporter permease [Acrocarpospora phusangensis]|uniref:ABC transporter permease n=1 Tax=Acrocarpospora phusangensis TaxID=1070424 RepID=UPI0019517DEB|nr:ABC transporter permease [Acrocarpospora phusangensis]
MTRFIIRRVLFGVIVLWLVATTVFLLFFAGPADNVARRLAGPRAPMEVIEQIKDTLGLNRSMWEQYASFLGNLLHGDLGISFISQTPVTTLIMQSLPGTLWLVAGAAVLWMAAGITGGVISAVRPRSVLDRTTTVLVLAGISLPTFVLGMLMVYLALSVFPWTGLQPGPYISPLLDLKGFLQVMIMPWVCLAVVQAAVYVRLTRGSMLDTLGEDYIRTARAKGAPERRVTYRHGLRAALTPVVTQFGVDIGTLLGGVVVTESVFGLQGLGQLMIRSVRYGDLPVIIGAAILASAFIVVANIVVDVAYSFLDPRVRLA